MTDFIKDFYYGRIDPQNRDIRQNARLQEVLSILSDREQALWDKLPEAEKPCFWSMWKLRRKWTV